MKKIDWFILFLAILLALTFYLLLNKKDTSNYNMDSAIESVHKQNIGEMYNENDYQINIR